MFLGLFISLRCRTFHKSFTFHSILRDTVTGNVCSTEQKQCI